MKPAIWTCYLFDLSPEEMVRTFAARDWRELELGDEHGSVLLARGSAARVGREFAQFAAGEGVSFPQGHLWLRADIAAIDQAATLEKLKPWLDLYVAAGVKAAVLHPGGEEMKKQAERGMASERDAGILPACRADILSAHPEEQQQRRDSEDTGGTPVEHMGETPMPHADKTSATQKRIKEANVKALRAITSHLRGSGMTICLENCGQDAPELLDLIDAVGSDAPEGLAVCLDTGHHNVAKGNQGDFIRKTGARLRALHLHDNDGSGDQHMLPYGIGTINWKDVFAVLKEVGYSGLYNWEIPGERQGPLEVRLAKLDYLRAIWPALSSGQTMTYDDMSALWRQLK